MVGGNEYNLLIITTKLVELCKVIPVKPLLN